MVGKGAIETVLACKPNLILLDLNLPDKHGIDILIELQSNDLTKNIPVVVISADAMPNQIDHLLALGAKDYLTKPIEINSFLRVVDAFVK
jgi:CheY-like chemotaxis protein